MLSKVHITEPLTLREIRLLTGKTQKDFAAAVGIPLSTYKTYEYRPGKMEAGKLLHICEVLGVPLEKIALK